MLKIGFLLKNYGQAIVIILLLIGVLFFVRFKILNTDNDGIITEHPI